MQITTIGDMKMSEKGGMMTGILFAWSQDNNFVVGLKIGIISFCQGIWGRGKGKKT